MSADFVPDYERLYREAACGLLVTRRDGTLCEANDTFCRWVGHERNALIGLMRFQDLLSVGGKMFHQTHWTPLLEMQGSVSEVKFEFCDREGKRFPAMVNAIRRVRDGSVWHELAVSMAEDRQAYERELMHQRKRAEDLLASEIEAQKALSVAEAKLRAEYDASTDRAAFAEQLLGIVGHDLRSSLSTIFMATDVMRRRSVTGEQARHFDIITGAARGAQELINCLLDFTIAKIGGGIAVTWQSIHLHELVARYVQSLALSHATQSFTHSTAGTGICRADSYRIEQLLANLVIYAITNGGQKPVGIVSSIGDDEFSIEVRYAGTPIPPELIPNLFNPMVRGAVGTGTRSVGLGLFIVREIVKAHHGRIEVTSSSAEGTRFTAILPRRPARQPRPKNDSLVNVQEIRP